MKIDNSTLLIAGAVIASILLALLAWDNTFTPNLINADTLNFLTRG